MSPLPSSPLVSLVVLVFSCWTTTSTTAFVPFRSSHSSSQGNPLSNTVLRRQPFVVVVRSSSSNNDSPPPSPSAPPPPMFNGKRVLPGSIVLAGLKASSSKIPAVYALYPTQKTLEGVSHVGVTQDFMATLSCWQQPLAGVRALSFTYPQPTVMQDIANEWKQEAITAGAQLVEWVDASAYLYDNDDDEDDDDDEWEDEESAFPVVATSTAAPATTATSNIKEEEEEETVVSPFDASSAPVTPTTSGNGALEFTVESVDRVLDEVRPYLVADGGNVAVVGVDAEQWQVQLELQGACGSCPSSTVTMQMGIERTLKEQFGSQVTVVQVTSDTANTGVSEPLEQVVQDELKRLSQAVIAMGGVVRLIGVDPTTGVVQLQFRGANKLKSGLELAIRDVAGVNAVQFVSGVEEASATTTTAASSSSSQPAADESA